jgi:hypothetical protein
MNKIIIVHYEEDPAAVEAFEEAVEHLWCKTVDYTRNAIISILSGIDDIDAVATRLMSLQEDIGNAIAPYYGNEAADAVTTLLKQHVTILVDIIKNIKDGKSTEQLETSLQANVDAIATFLDSADPDNWPKDVVLSLLKKHIACTLKIARSRFAKDWPADFDAYEECKNNIEQLAYAMAGGILNKFPEMFVMQYSSKTIKKK